MNGVLGNYFDALYVISLEQRKDRRSRLGTEMQKLGLAEPDDVTWVRAVEGAKCWAPSFFAAGSGAWGCLQSHLRILQDAIMDGHERILVLEDDATFHRRSAEMMDLFFRQVPADWDQIFLGGEHAAPPELIKHRPFVLKGRGVHRTHAFAMRREVLPLIHQHIANFPDYMKGGEWHVDHQLGAAHGADMWKTYAPAWWIVGQKGGASDISEMKNPDYWWHPGMYGPQLSFIRASQDEVENQEMLLQSIHFGNHLLPGSLQDMGLDKCVGNDRELVDWLRLIAAEALAMGKLPGIQHPSISRQRISALWTGRLLDIEEINPTALRDFPFIGRFRHPGDVRRICGDLRLEIDINPREIQMNANS